jgi:hypothetical protein
MLRANADRLSSKARRWVPCQSPIGHHKRLSIAAAAFPGCARSGHSLVRSRTAGIDPCRSPILSNRAPEADVAL